jgi:TorA maturation chaperone TorD
MTTALDTVARCDLYALTARLFMAEVDAELYRALVAQDALGLIDKTLRTMHEERAVEVLAVEFCRLFVGPQPLCVPYASAHQGEALLGGRTRTRLEEFLCRVDINYDLAAMRIAAPDHIAVVLATLAQLSVRADMAAVAHEFLHHYVLPWVPAYCERVAASTALDFYRMTAQLTMALLAAEENV